MKSLFATITVLLLSPSAFAESASRDPAAKPVDAVAAQKLHGQSLTDLAGIADDTSTVTIESLGHAAEPVVADQN